MKDTEFTEISFYFRDLIPEAQARLLQAQHLSTPEEGNYDIDVVPLFTVITEDEIL